MPDLSIPSDVIPSGRIITARSYLIDRFQPDVEQIVLPEKPRVGGKLHWDSGTVTAPARPVGRRQRLLGGRPGQQVAPADRWIVDLRSKSPENWAHFLNNHLPLVFGLADLAGRDLAEALLLLPKAVPGYIKGAAALFGLEVLGTDDAVTGPGVAYEVQPWTALRPIRHAWVNLPAPQAALAALDAEAPAQPLPRKVFLSRQDTRKVSNAPEIEALLEAQGYKTVFPETLSAADQMRLVRGADEVVAVHSAGLAPLLYCQPGRGPRRLIELLPCGHMTDVYRAIAAQVGSAWIGVRGRIKPEYVQPAYRLDNPFTAYSLDDFEVDPVALEQALEMTKTG